MSTDLRTSATALAIHGAICEDSWTDCTEDRDGSCWKGAQAAVDQHTMQQPGSVYRLLADVEAFGQTFEAVPPREPGAAPTHDEEYDHGYAIGHNDALTALNQILNGART